MSKRYWSTSILLNSLRLDYSSVNRDYLISEITERKSVRIIYLDVLRGMAVLAMISYHFFWDLGFFGYIDFSLATTGFGLIIAQIIGSSFLLISGFSLNLSISSKSFQTRFWWRFLKLLSFSCNYDA